MKTPLSLIKQLLLSTLFLVGMFLMPLHGQVSDQDTSSQDSIGEMLNLFLDCEDCDQAYIRQEFPAVNYVRIQEDADVHLLIARQWMPGGGANFELAFIGRKELKDMNTKLFYFSDSNETPDERREGLLRTIEIGLVPFLARAGMQDQLQISIPQPNATAKVTPEQDPWGHWIYRVSANGSMSLESLRKEHSLRLRGEAEHVTDQWRVRLRYFNNYNRTAVQGDDELFISERRNQGGWGSVAYSLSDHWSVGGGVSASQDTWANFDASVAIAPAIEYSIFPYQEVMRRELTVAYRLRGRYNDYTRETVYGKMQESLLQQELALNLRLRQPWGQVFTGLEGSHYFHDFSRYNLSFNTDIDLRVYKGLSFSIAGRARLIRDQLSLPAGEASLEDLLLQQSQLATSYDVRVWAGVSYTFGSIYNNIVNTRL